MVESDQTVERDIAPSFQSPVQWYPGHIAKWDRQLLDTASRVDVIIDVRDARLPQTSTHPELSQRLGHKPQVVVMTKAELADPERSTQWRHWYKQQKTPCLLVDSHSGQGIAQVVQAVLKAGQPAMQSGRSKGLKDRPARVLIVGLPNVGKSSLINKLVGRKKTATGHKAGVTRQLQWVRLHPQLELLDSPGVIPARLDTPESGALLSVVSALGEAAYDELAVGAFLMRRIEQVYPGLIATHYKMQEDWLAEPLLSMAQARQLLALGGVPDQQRAAQLVLKDFRQGRLGRLTLDPLPIESAR